jgi:uncharacterized protein YndB with AHSA1/START domain
MTKPDVETPGETQIVVRRAFAAPPALVFRAHVDAALIPRWMNVMPGWTMPSAKATRARAGRSASLGGRPGRRIPHRGRIPRDRGRAPHPPCRTHVLPDPTPDNRVETLFQASDGGTLLVMTMTLPDAETRRAMLATGMTEGMEMTYARLDALLERRPSHDPRRRAPRRPGPPPDPQAPARAFDRPDPAKHSGAPVREGGLSLAPLVHAARRDGRERPFLEIVPASHRAFEEDWTRETTVASP